MEVLLLLLSRYHNKLIFLEDKMKATKKKLRDDYEICKYLKEYSRYECGRGNRIRDFDNCEGFKVSTCRKFEAINLHREKE